MLLASNLYFFIKENFISAMTRNHIESNANIILNSLYSILIYSLNPIPTKSQPFLVFKANIITFIQLSSSSAFVCHNSKDICFITRLSLVLINLREHKFKPSLKKKLSSLCSCGNNVEPTKHLLLHCSKFVNEKRTITARKSYFLYPNVPKIVFSK